MSYLFEHDATAGILQGRLYGKVTSEELWEYYRIAVKCAAAKRPRGTITDITGVTSLEVTPETLRELATLRPPPAGESLAQVVVASSPEMFGMARMFELMGESTRPNLHVVRTHREAFAILGVKDPKFGPIEIERVLAGSDEGA